MLASQKDGHSPRRQQGDAFLYGLLGISRVSAKLHIAQIADGKISQVHVVIAVVLSKLKEARRMASGPSLEPERKEAVQSKGSPTTT
jgi:hypothetical protein